MYRTQVAHDPWIAGYDVGRSGVPKAPVLMIMTQSMMYPSNAEAISTVMRAVVAATEDAAAVYAEALECRPGLASVRTRERASKRPPTSCTPEYSTRISIKACIKINRSMSAAYWHMSSY